jgi:hypothetical protein
MKQNFLWENLFTIDRRFKQKIENASSNLSGKNLTVGLSVTSFADNQDGKVMSYSRAF